MGFAKTAMNFDWQMWGFSQRLLILFCKLPKVAQVGM